MSEERTSREGDRNSLWSDIKAVLAVVEWTNLRSQFLGLYYERMSQNSLIIPLEKDE